MSWNLDSNIPIYTQLIRTLRHRIISGNYPPGSRLPSVRELAGEAGVNPNTMQRALSQLEGSGLIITNRTSGRLITEDTDMIAQARTALAGEQINTFISEMQKLGYKTKDIPALIKKIMEEKNS